MENTALGDQALFANDTTGSGLANWNTAVGSQALFTNMDGSLNSAIGFQALYFNSSGIENTAVGSDALARNDTGGGNNAVGAFALAGNVSGFANNAHGRNALQASNGDQNNAFGDSAMLNNKIGSSNIAIGDHALASCVDGNSNIAIGDQAGTGIIHASNNIMIGVSNVSSAFGEADNTTYINHIFGQPVGVGPGQAVFVDSDGVLGFTTSSRRVKHDIKPMNEASEALYGLRPVTFKYNKDKSGMTCFGLIAEDVAEVNPELVLRDKQGEASSVRYEQINAMLLNEFLKEHRKVEQLEKQVEMLSAGLQKVSAELELSKSSPKTVGNQ
jgi:hypothetical protein